MRRVEREVNSKLEIKNIILKGSILNLGLNSSVFPYVVPLNYIFKEENDNWFIYFHSAKQGYKIDLINKDERCGFTIYNDLGVKLKEKSNSGTNLYECIMGTGYICEVKEFQEKHEIAKKLLRKYGYVEDIQIENEVIEKTYIGKITIKEISGKANREK